MDGKCFDTSMGLTPLEGVLMGTRSGDLDPAVVECIANNEHLTPSETLTILNKKSGLVGLSGVEISVSVPRVLAFFSASSLTPRNSRPFKTSARPSASFSPMPAVKMMASSPPMAAA